MDAAPCTINTLPPELLAAIFVHGLPPLPLSQPRHRNTFPPWPLHPILVSHVCVHWRRVALAAPRLWAEIALPTLKPSALATHLTRSKAAPLDIALDVWAADAALPGDCFARALVALAPHAHRWRTLRIATYREESAAAALAALAPLALPRLELLAVSMEERVEDDEDLEDLPEPALVCAPRLARLRADTAHVLRLPLEHLTVLHLARAWGSPAALALPELRAVLTAPAALHTLTLEGALLRPDAPAPDDDSTPIPLPALRTLTLARTRAPHDAAALLRLLAVPALDALALEDADAPELAALAAGPPLPATRLALHSATVHARAPAPPTALVDLAKALPRVTHATLTQCAREGPARAAALASWPALRTLALAAKRDFPAAPPPGWSVELAAALGEACAARDADKPLKVVLDGVLGRCAKGPWEVCEEAEAWGEAEV